MERAQILEEIGKMTVLELSQLIKDMEEKFGVEDSTSASSKCRLLINSVCAQHPSSIGKTMNPNQQHGFFRPSSVF